MAKDAELSFTQNTQTALCKFTLAVDRPKKKGEDNGADFIRIVVWGVQAENCDRYLHKGSQCAVSGWIQTGSYKDKEGRTVYTTDVVADRVEFLGSQPAEREERTEPKRTVEDTLGDLGDFGSFSTATDDMPF